MTQHHLYQPTKLPLFSGHQCLKAPRGVCLEKRFLIALALFSFHTRPLSDWVSELHFSFSPNCIANAIEICNLQLSLIFFYIEYCTYAVDACAVDKYSTEIRIKMRINNSEAQIRLCSFCSGQSLIDSNNGHYGKIYFTTNSVLKLHLRINMTPLEGCISANSHPILYRNTLKDF